MRIGETSQEPILSRCAWSGKGEHLTNKLPRDIGDLVGSLEVSDRIHEIESGHENGYVWGARSFPSEINVPFWLTPPLERRLFGALLFPAQP
jgi:hypothetical protein